MKTFKNKFKILLLLLLVGFAFTCCSSDDGITILRPTVSYSETTLEPVFFTEGSAPVPSVDWNGNTGSFSLSMNIDGLSIDRSTGAISWTTTLPPGTHDFDVIATNNAGQTTVRIQLNNPVEGFLTGTYDYSSGPSTSSSYFALDFHENGTLDFLSNNQDNPDEGSGTWVRTGDEIKVDYTYDIAGDHYSLSGTLVQGLSRLEYSGTWYYGHGTVPESEVARFKVAKELP